MSKIPLKKLADFCHRTSTSYRAGIDVVQIFRRESAQGSSSYRAAMRTVLDAVSRGQTVAEGLRATGGYFPELVCAIAESGETSGRLDRSFQLLSKHYDSLVRFRRDMLGRLAWPAFELFSAMLIVAVMLLVLGWINRTMNTGGDKERFDAFGLGWSDAGYFWTWVSVCVLFTGSLVAGVYGTMAGWFGDRPMRIARRIPLLGKTIQIMSLARFAWVLAAVYEAGMNTMRGVALAFRSTRNHWFARHEDYARLRLQAGASLHEVLRETGAFPDDLLMYVENGEMTGDLPEAMNRLAEQYNDEAEKNLALISKIVFFMVFAFVALIVAFIVISFWVRYITGLQSIAG